jgi:hypothetical protein
VHRERAGPDPRAAVDPVEDGEHLRVVGIVSTRSNTSSAPARLSCASSLWFDDAS